VVGVCVEAVGASVVLEDVGEAVGASVVLDVVGEVVGEAVVSVGSCAQQERTHNKTNNILNILQNF
jgi:hypothetical protein